jgi:dCMP deaminase
MTRPTVDLYFLRMAELAATRATCDRKHVGAVIVKDKRVVSTGYNGSPKGLPHCDEVDHLMKTIDGRPSCIRTLHAESNALDDAGRRAQGATLYCTVTPCYECAKRIINAGIVRVLVAGEYQSQNTGLVPDLFKEAGVSFQIACIPKPATPTSSTP